MGIDQKRGDLPINSGPVVHSVHGRLQPVVCQTHQIVADVDNKGAWDRRSLDPLSVLVEHLKTTVHVLPE